MKQNTWLKCNVNMFEHFGGSTVRITSDYAAEMIIGDVYREVAW